MSARLAALSTAELVAELHRRGFTDDAIAAQAGVEPDVLARALADEGAGR